MWALGIEHVTERRAVAFVASAITDLPTHLPTLRFQFCRLLKSNVQLCNFVSVPPYYGYVMCSFLRIWNKGQAAAVGLAWLPVAYEK